MKEKCSRTRKSARYFLIAKILFGITPLVGYLYLSLNGMLLANSLQSLLANNPGLVVIFILALLNPYISYLLSLIEKDLATGKYDCALANMGLVLLSQLVCLNFFYWSLLLYVFYQARKDCRFDLKVELGKLTFKKLLAQGGGGLIVLALNLLCMVTTIKIL